MFLQGMRWSSEKTDHLALCFPLNCEAAAAICPPEGWRWQTADQQCLKTAVSLFDKFVCGKIYISSNGNLNQVQLHLSWSFLFQEESGHGGWGHRGYRIQEKISAWTFRWQVPQSQEVANVNKKLLLHCRGPIHVPSWEAKEELKSLSYPW